MSLLNLLPRFGQLVGLLPQSRHFTAQARQVAHLRILYRRIVRNAGRVLGGARYLLLQRLDLRRFFFQFLVLLAQGFDALELQKIHDQRGQSHGANDGDFDFVHASHLKFDSIIGNSILPTALPVSRQF